MPDPAIRVKGPRGGRAPARRTFARALACALIGLVVACAAPGPAASPPRVATATPVYPPTPRVRQVDVYHGVAVTDPWRWLEELDAPAVHRWVGAENAVSKPYLEALPARAAFKARLTARGNYERFGAALAGGSSYVLPQKHGEQYFYLHSTGIDDQSVLLVADSLEGPPRVLLDPNSFSADRTVALADFEVSPDGRYLAYALSDGGSDWKTWHVREVVSGLDLPERIEFTKFTSIAWAGDSRGLYYSRYPVRADGAGDAARQVSVYFHSLVTPQSSDRLVYALSDNATRNPYPTISDDGRWLVLTVTEGFATNAIHYLDLAQPGSAPVRLFDRWDGRYSFLGNDGPEFYFLSTAGAPRGRVIAVNLARPAEERIVIPESEESIEDAHYVGGRLVLSFLTDAHTHVRLYRPDGRPSGELALPGLGQVTGFAGHADDAETFYAYTDYLTPWTIYRYRPTTNESALFRRPSVALDPAVYLTEQVFYRSKDGTRVPMFVTRRRDMPRDGAQPTLLYGYGGFDIPQLPIFSVPVSAWLDSGGVFAVANLRGGSEYGEAWHAAGTKTHKQNVFDDFIAAAEWLIANGITSPRHLAIQGRSNGGLLIGATEIQRPDLFAAALPVVGVLDMLRYDTASANARQWSSDYGLASDADEFKALAAYSPVQNVRAGVCYPPTLITTADHDDRVAPWHSFKFAAALQSAQPHAHCPNPVLLRVESRAGHGAGKPTWMQIEDFADQWSFAAENVGLHVAPP
jgi:prolyl oligopeptidase